MTFRKTGEGPMSKQDKDGRKKKARQQNGCLEETEGLARLTHGPELDL